MASSRAGLLAIYETRSWSLSLHRSVHLPTQMLRVRTLHSRHMR